MTPLLFMIAALAAPIQGPDPGRVHGTVRDEATGAPLPAVVVEAAGGADGMVVTDERGRYVLPDVPAGTRRLRARRVGYEPLDVEVYIPSGGDLTVDFTLTLRPVALSPIAVSGSARGAAGDTVAAPPATLAEAGIRALEAAPTAMGSGAGKAGGAGGEPAQPSDLFYVRGSSAELNLMLIDGAPVHAPFQLAGILPAFPRAALRDATFYRGGAPARYDGGLSYVLDLRTRAGRRDRLHASGGVDLLSAGGAVDGPIGSSGAFRARGRAIHPAGMDAVSDARFPYGYRDGLVRLDVAPADDHTIRATAFGNEESVLLDPRDAAAGAATWGNAAASVRYDGTVLGARARLTAAWGRFRARLPVPWSEAAFADGTVERSRAAARFETGSGDRRMEYGATIERVAFDYRAADRSAEGGTTASGTVAGAFAEGRWQVLPRLRIRAGGRLDAFSADGTVRASPRIAAVGLLSDHTTLTLAAGRFSQYARVSDATVATGLRATRPFTSSLSVARASHLVLRLREHLGGGVRLGLEGYAKSFDGLPIGGAGTADASGVDVWVRRTAGRVTGWLGYSLAWIWTDAPSYARGARFTGRHILNAGLEGPIGSDGGYRLRFTYGAGLPYTALTLSSDAPGLDGPSVSEGSVAQLSSSVRRDPPLTGPPSDAYLRLDVEVFHEWTYGGEGRTKRIAPYVKLLNALGRRNALFYHVDPDASARPEPVAALPIVPLLGLRWTL